MRFTPPLAAFAASATVLAGCGPSISPQKQQQSSVDMRVAAAAISSGFPALALRIADGVLTDKPDDVPALILKGDALYAMGSNEPAAAAYQRAAELSPSNATARVGIGRTLLKSDPKAAEAAFDKALALQPDNVTALNNLGIVRDMQGRHDDAQKAYYRAMALAPANEAVRANFRLSMSMRGQPAPPPESAPVPPPADAAPGTARGTAAAAPAVAAAGPPPPAGPEPAAPPASAPLADAAAPPAQPAPAPAAAAVAVASAAPARADAASRAEPDAAPAEPLRPPPGPAAAGYYAQLGALVSDRAAQEAWQGLAARWPDLFAGRAPVVQQAEIKQRTIWRLRTGPFADAAGAQDFCARLRAAGPGCWSVMAARN